ncbi:MAG: cystathionine beta-synthase [Gaiellales bacterium]|nr:cystathionine beta-synthase [Gaiellales bacterium]
MREFPTILDLIGHTPVIQLPQMQPSGAGRVLAKLEYVNPGGSIKDRIALPMIEAAERDGRLRPGGTIVEATSGNTGVGLAMVAAQRGYRCVFVMPDKMSREKIALLRAFGAEVVVCPTEVEPADPRSYYSVSQRIAKETPGSYNPNQYANAGNPQAHYDSTGPEIWEQLGDELDVLVVGVGTGGTVTGTGRYLKERKPGIEIVGADPVGSIYSTPDPHSYLVEGVGEDFWPTTFDRAIVDRWIQVSDREAFATTRRLARLEGILIGASGGMALHAALRVAHELPPDKSVLVVLPDGGRPYLSKVFNDDWMLVHGMFDDAARPPTAGELVASRTGEVPALVSVGSQQPVADAIALLQRYAVSQLPVIDDGEVLGCVHERTLLDRAMRDGRGALEAPTSELMSDPLPVVQAIRRLDDVYHDLQSSPAVLVADGNTPIGVLTRADVLEWLAHA